MQVSPGQVYQQTLAMGGDQLQAQVAAALVSGIESDGDPTELSGGVGPAAGLFQFEPSTWQANGGGAYGSVAQDATWQQQIQVFLNATKGDNFGAWGPDLVSNEGDPNSASNPPYGYSGAPQAGSKVANIIAQDSASWGAAQPAVSSSASAAPTANATTAAQYPSDSTTIAGQTYSTPAGDANAASQLSALAQLNATLSTYGFSGSDLTTLTNWAWGEITNNVDPSQVALDIQTPGSAVYPIFQKYFPGFTSANQQLNAQGLPAVSVTQYQQYQTQAQAMAQAAGLPPGFINKNNIGALVGGNVSTTELSARLTDATTLAINSSPTVRQYFNQYFGLEDQWVTGDNPFGTGSNAYNAHGPLSTGQIAALVLDPKASEPLIKQQILAAQVGGDSATGGIGGVSEAEAMKIAQLNPDLTSSAIESAVGQASVYNPFLQSLPGQGREAKQATITPDQLIGTQLSPNEVNQRQLQTAEEVGKAPFTGGGGFVQNTKGAVGVGSSSPTGSGQ